jgi:hypothetical protein
MALPTFENKAELYEYLVKNKQEIINIKKGVVKCSDNIYTPKEVEFEGGVQKSLLTNHKDNDEVGVIKRTIVGNTYNWLDSHSDVHLNGIFAKSIEERKNKVNHYHDHLNQLTAKVGKFTEIYERRVRWADFGIEKQGYTQALFAESEIKKDLNPVVYTMYKNGEIDQHSVGMVYVKINLAINDEAYKEEFAEWNKHIDKIGNVDAAMEQGYFWAVSEAKLIEISAVPEGSNSLTPTVANATKEIHSEEEPPKSTPIEEPIPITEIDVQKLTNYFKTKN